MLMRDEAPWIATNIAKLASDSIYSFRFSPAVVG
jgi:hypothetical protein